MLDFDHDKVCSVTLSNVNVYACLVCGKFFRGRAPGTPAHTHSLQEDHHVFLNLSTQRAYCLPEDYEIEEHALDDVRRMLDPRFSEADARELHKGDPRRVNCRVMRWAGGAAFVPGIVGLNNLSHTDSFNAILQCLMHVPRFRDYFLRTATLPSMMLECVALMASATVVLEPGTVAGTLGLLMRKMWRASSCRPHVSPHEILHLIEERSKGRFTIGVPMEPIALLQWLLHQLSTELKTTTYERGKRRRRTKTIVEESFQGIIEVTTVRPVAVRMPDPQQLGSICTVVRDEVEVKQLPFYYLSLDLPPMPLFPESDGQSFLPQVPIMTLLQKFDGKSEVVLPTGERKRYRLIKLPQYLIVHIKRFTHNNWFLEKNSTIVNFPLTDLDLRSFIKPEALASNPATKYDLIAMLKHDGLPVKNDTERALGTNNYVTAYCCTVSGKWFEIQDLVVRQTLPDLIAVSEAYIQIYNRRRVPTPRKPRRPSPQQPQQQQEPQQPQQEPVAVQEPVQEPMLPHPPQGPEVDQELMHGLVPELEQLPPLDISMTSDIFPFSL